jgi:hypothetical protein
MRTEGFASMKIVTKQKLSFSIPSTSDLTVILNPCHTDGFLTKLPISILYGIGNKRNFEFSAQPKAMEVIFNSGPIRDKNKNLYSMLIENTNISLSSKNAVYCTEDPSSKLCAKPGIINQILEITPVNGKLILNPKTDKYLSSGLNVSLAELNNFYGLAVTSGRCSIALISDSTSISIDGTILQGLLGTKFASVHLEFPIKSVDQTSVVLTSSQSKQEVTFQIQQLKDYFISNGFTRVELYPKENKNTSDKRQATSLEIKLFTE